MKREKVTSYLIIANLILIFLYLINKFSVYHEFVKVLVWVILMPCAFGIFIFYILRPLNNIFLKKGLKKSKAASLTLFMAIFILAAILKVFANYFAEQVTQLFNNVLVLMEDETIKGFINEYTSGEKLTGVIENTSTMFMEYINLIISNAKNLFDLGMMGFSNILLILLIVFFLLKDGEKVKPKILKYCPKKYKNIVSKTLKEGDEVLSTYIIGQATVALSLATMVFIGYKIIGMPSALLLASTTFVLAFIPFIGFFISMIIPYIIAIIMGVDMLIKLSAMFIIAQTLKGRVVVPFIMGRAMKIHPITDIFLVVGAAAIGGPLAAFSVVPIYALLKLSIKNMNAEGLISFKGNIDKKN